jgi:hypothetical protein
MYVFSLKSSFASASFRIMLMINVSRDSSFSNVIGCGLDDQGLISGSGFDFSLCHCAHTSSEAHLAPGAWVLGVL